MGKTVDALMAEWYKATYAAVAAGQAEQAAVWARRAADRKLMDARKAYRDALKKEQM